jgi:hypothetical protein
MSELFSLVVAVNGLGCRSFQIKEDREARGSQYRRAVVIRSRGQAVSRSFLAVREAGYGTLRPALTGVESPPLCRGA